MLSYTRLSSVGPRPVLVFLSQFFDRSDCAPHNFRLNLRVPNGDHAGGVMVAGIVQHRVSVRIGVVVELGEATAVLALIR